MHRSWLIHLLVQPSQFHHDRKRVHVCHEQLPRPALQNLPLSSIDIKPKTPSLQCYPYHTRQLTRNRMLTEHACKTTTLLPLLPNLQNPLPAALRASGSEASPALCVEHPQPLGVAVVASVATTKGTRGRMICRRSTGFQGVHPPPLAPRRCRECHHKGHSLHRTHHQKLSCRP